MDPPSRAQSSTEVADRRDRIVHVLEHVFADHAVRSAVWERQSVLLDRMEVHTLGQSLDGGVLACTLEEHPLMSTPCTRPLGPT